MTKLPAMRGGGTRWVVFDVGGVLVNEARLWRGWAARLGMQEAELLAALRAGIAAGNGIGGTLRALAPGLDLRAERARLARLEIPEEADLYPDVRPAIVALRRAGVRIGIAGNQPPGVAEALARLGLGAAFIATSATWGVAKPDPRFFVRVREATGAPPERIAYVGDRLDNDVAPARAAGLRALFLPRGLWGELHDAEAHGAERLASLLELPARLS
ncbi:MAG: HAD family hydrolase [Roseococcus sp.]|nr:HAD family hydrolase [Roseococcus sp.]